MKGPFSMLGFFGLTLWIDIFTLIIYRKSKNKLKRINPYKPLHEVSIIIPAYKEEDHVITTIQSLKQERYPIKHIVVCGDKESGLMRRVVELMQPAYKNVIYMECPEKSKSQKINFVIKTMGRELGEFVYVRDARVTGADDCIEKMVSCFGSKNVAAVTSYGRLSVPKSILSKAYHYGKAWINEIGRFRKDAQEKRAAVFVVCGASTMYRVGVLSKIPIPSRTKTEDTYYTWLLQMKKYRVRVADDAIVQAPDVDGEKFEGIKNQIKQTFRWSSGTMQCFYYEIKNYKKGKSLFLTTILPGFLEAITYSIFLISFPLLVFISPVFFWGFLLGDTLFSLFGTLIVLPNKFIKTLLHYPEIIFFKYVNSLAFMTAFFIVSYQAITGKTDGWSNEWTPPETKKTTPLSYFRLRALQRLSLSLVLRAWGDFRFFPIFFFL